jgi:excisionase family DNA binding protein
MVALHEFTDRVLANVIRKVARNGFPQQTETIAHGDDLPKYFCGLHPWMSTSEVADLLHCHVGTVYRRIKGEGLPAKKDGRRWQFDPAKIARWLLRHPLEGAVRKPRLAFRTLKLLRQLPTRLVSPRNYLKLENKMLHLFQPLH